MGFACLVAGGSWLALTWLGYPAYVAARSLGKPAIAGRGFGGSVAIIIVARDEARHIAERVAELRRLRIPEGCKLAHIIIVDDGSADATAAIAETAAADGPLVILRQPRSGKAAGLAHAAGRTDADVLVFADVRQRIGPDALVELLAPLGDPAIGVVSGVVVKPARTAAGLYWRYESLVRRWESRSGSTIGATGPWYAVRRALFVPPPAGLLLDDVWIPMHAVFAGARAVVAERAVVIDVEHAPAIERHKKARTLTGNLQLLRAWPALLDPRRNPVWARYFAHKVARLGTPFALTAVAVGGIALALTPGPLQPLGVGVVALHAGVIAAALLGFAPARSAVEVHLASLDAWVRWVRRDFRW